MTSSALFFVAGCLSTGMPRPSSEIVIELPSACSVTTMFDAKPFMASSTALSRISQTRWCKTGGADAADVHAGPLADRLQPFEDGDVFGGVATHQRRRRRPWSGPVLRVALWLVWPCVHVSVRASRRCSDHERASAPHPRGGASRIVDGLRFHDGRLSNGLGTRAAHASTGSATAFNRRIVDRFRARRPQPLASASDPETRGLRHVDPVRPAARHLCRPHEANRRPTRTRSSFRRSRDGGAQKLLRLAHVQGPARRQVESR